MVGILASCKFCRLHFVSHELECPEDFKAASYAEIVAGVIDIPLCLSAMALVFQIVRAKPTMRRTTSKGAVDISDAFTP